jgi:hypothetical protein
MSQARNNHIKELVLIVALFISLMLGSLAAWGSGGGGGDGAPPDPTNTPTPTATRVAMVLSSTLA